MSAYLCRSGVGCYICPVGFSCGDLQHSTEWTGNRLDGSVGACRIESSPSLSGNE